MPSFGMWTSTIVKEAISCFFSSFVLIWLIDIIEHKKQRFKTLVLYLLCLYFTILLRPIVGVCLFITLIILMSNNSKIYNKYLRFFFLSFLVFFSLILIYFITLKFIKNEFIPLAKYYFDPKYTDSKSLRSNDFWLNVQDFYFKAPEGILISNIGPNLSESIMKPFYIPYFFEGLFFIFSILYFLLNIFYRFIYLKIIDTNFIFILIFSIGLILLLNYPFGLFNPGSATRYRSSYFHIIITLLYYFYSNNKKLT